MKKDIKRIEILSLMNQLELLTNIETYATDADIKSFKKKLTTLISNPDQIPMLMGYFSSENIIKHLKPESRNDKLTVETFYMGIAEVQNNLKPAHDIFKSFIQKEKIQGKDNYKDIFLNIQIEINKTIYNLNLQTNIGESMTYSASVKKSVPKLTDLMDSYLGPNVQK